MADIYEKKHHLEDHLRELGSIAVAYSAGVDSTFLLKTAHDVLGEKAIAVTVRSCLVPEREFAEAENFCKSLGVKHIIFDIDPLKIKGFSENPSDRCYICKKEIFGQMREIVKKQGISYIAEGSNADDVNDYRPGMKAVKELGIKSPLPEAGLSKADIRRLSKEEGLSTWDKPSFACLASRFVYGENITAEKLSAVEKAEEFLRELEFSQYRVRVHGKIARIEISPHEFEKILISGNAEKISSYLHKLGFLYVALDLDGYRTGSMNTEDKIKAV